MISFICVCDEYVMFMVCDYSGVKTKIGSFFVDGR